MSKPNFGKRLKWKAEALWWGLRHRTIDKYHVIPTGLKPGYYDKDIQMLHANFQLLVNFVEVECAALRQALNGVIFEIPNPREGVARLQEEVKFGGKQGEDAQEALVLYWWWTEIRPRRDENDFDMESVYYQQDTEMLVRLVKLRGFLWT